MRLTLAIGLLSSVALAQPTNGAGDRFRNLTTTGRLTATFIDAGVIHCANDISADGNINTGASFQSTAATAPNLWVSKATNANVNSSTCAAMIRGNEAYGSGDCIWAVGDENGNPIVRVTRTGVGSGALAIAASSDISGSSTSDTAMRTYYCSAASGSNCLNVNTEGARVLTGPDTYWSESGTSMVATAAGGVQIPNFFTCTLNAGSPSTCTATVRASSTCVCANVGTTAAIAGNACAVSLSGTTLTVTSANAANNVVNIWCDR